MFTTDLALKLRSGLRGDLASASADPDRLRRRLRQGLVQADAPRHGAALRYLGAEVPKEVLIWQDPVPAVDHPLVDAEDIKPR
jgi:catalase-peroxidase